MITFYFDNKPPHLNTVVKIFQVGDIVTYYTRDFLVLDSLRKRNYTDKNCFLFSKEHL